MPTLYIARVAKLADALDLGSSVLRHAGSSPASRTILSIFSCLDRLILQIKLEIR